MANPRTTQSTQGGSAAHLSELQKRVSDNADEIWTRESSEIREKAVQLRALVDDALDGVSKDPKASAEAAKQAREAFGQLSTDLRDTRTTAKARLRRQILGLTPDESPQDRRLILDQAIGNFVTPKEVVAYGDAIAGLEHRVTRAAELQIASEADKTKTQRAAPSPAPS